VNITINGKEKGIVFVSLILALMLIVPGGFFIVGSAQDTTVEVESAPVQNQIHLKYADFDPMAGTPDIPSRLMSQAPSIPNTKMPYIIQHDGPITEAWVNELGQAGVEIVSYIPDNAYLVRLSDDQVDTMRGHNGVRWLGDYHPAYKLDPQVDNANGMVDISVMLFPDATNSYVVKLLKIVGGEVLGIAHNDKVNTIKLRIDAAYIETLAAMPEVRYISMVEMNTILNDSTTQLLQTGSTTGTWPIFTTRNIRGQNQIAAIGDSGLRIDHQNFLGTVYGNGTEGKVITYFIPGDANAELGDEAQASYHGSHCAGTVLGDGPTTGTYGTYATATFDGHAYMARLVMMDCGRTDDPATPTVNEGDYIYTPSDMYNDYFLAAENWGAKVHSNSWGGGYGYDDGTAEIDRYLWDSQDYLVCFAAGNDGAVSTIGSQAEAKNLICVGGTTNDGTGQYTSTSQGPCYDGRIKPDVAAPAVNIESVNGGGTTTYQTMSGTSMACPATTGSAALVRQYYTEGWYPTGAKVAGNAMSAPSAALIKATMINGAVDYGTLNVPNFIEGWGRVHLENSLYFAGDTIKTAVVDNKIGLLTNDYVEYSYSVVAGTRLKVSLVWTDFEGDPAASKMLVNNMNLLVKNPSAVEYKGNVYTGGYSTTGGSYDTLNNVECFNIAAPATGVWTIRVTGYAIARGPQPFALVVSGALADGYGNVFMDRTVYGDEDTITIDVEDTNNPAGSVNVVLTTSSGDSETVSVPGTAANSGLFKDGSIVTGLGIIATGNGILEVFHGDIITATYADASPAHNSRAYAVVDMKGPVISNVYAGGILPTAAIIYWTTSENADSTVYYGTNPANLNLLKTETALAISHRVVLKDLASNTIYYFDVKSKDSRGRSVLDNNGGEHYMFSTTSAATGGNLVLLVDDDDGLASPLSGLGYEVDWINNLNAYGWTYTHWDFKVYGTPSLADMNSHTMVVWYVTEGYPQISKNDRPVLKAFLDQVENPEQHTRPMMYLVGQDIGWDMNAQGTDVDVAWFEYYTKTRFLGDDADGGAGVENDPFQVENVGHPLNIYSLADIDLEVECFDYPVADDRFWPDDLMTLTGGTRTFDYTSHRYAGGNCAGASQTAGGTGGQSRIVFHGFTHDMIASTNSGTADYNPEVPQIDPERSKMLDQVIQWLLGGNHPTIDLTYPTGGQTLSGTVSVTWTVSSAQSIDLYYSPNNGQAWTPLATGLAGTATSYSWNTAGLLTGVDYKVKVVAKSSATYATLTDYSESGAFRINGVDNLGPKCSAGTVTADKQPTVKGQTMWFNATVTDDGRGLSNINAVEYFIDLVKANGTGNAMNATDGSFNSMTEGAKTTYTGSSGLVTGRHTLFVHARDAASPTNNWGPFTSTTFDIISTTAMASARGPISDPTNDVDITITYSYANNPTSINLYYTMNGGATWVFIGNDAPVDGTYDYTITSGSGTYGWMAQAVGGGSDEPSPPTPGFAPEAGYYILDLIPPAAPGTLTVDQYGEQVTIDSETLTTAGTTAAGGPHNVWFCVVDSNTAAEFTTPNSATELTDAQYTSASTSNNVRATSATPGVGDYMFLKNQFATTMTPSEVTQIDLTFEGYWSAGGTASIYAYNAAGSTWSMIGGTQAFLATTDGTMIRTITGNCADFVSGGNILWGVAISVTRRAISVDFLRVYVESEIPFSWTNDNTLNWTHDEIDLAEYNIYRSDSEFGTYTLIDTVPIGTNTYQDDGKGTADNTTWWYIVRALDPLGNEEQNTNAEPEIDTGPTSPYNINLVGKSGWVFVSFPIGISGNVQTVLNDAQTTWDVAKWYDGQTKTWKSFRATGTQTLTTVNNQMGVWLHLTANGGDQMLTTTLTGSFPSSQVAINLYSGWNMVGYPSATPRLGTDTLPVQATAVSVWMSGTPYISDSTPGAVTMTEGNAYWVQVSEDCIWYVQP
jgi:hypothetical protein